MARNILDRVRYLGYLVDREVPSAKAQLRGAILRLRRQDPFRLQLPKHLKRSESDNEE